MSPGFNFQAFSRTLVLSFVRMLKASVIVFSNDVKSGPFWFKMDNFKFHFLSRGQFESLSLGMFSGSHLKCSALEKYLNPPMSWSLRLNTNLTGLSQVMTDQWPALTSATTAAGCWRPHVTGQSDCGAPPTQTLWWYSRLSIITLPLNLVVLIKWRLVRLFIELMRKEKHAEYSQLELSMSKIVLYLSKVNTKT